MRFSPGLKMTALLLVLLPLLLSLGFWQLQRAEEKRAILDLVEDRRNRQLEEFRLVEPLSDPAYYPVRIEGQYLQEVVLLDNQMLQGRFGYEWLQFFRSVEGQLVLISRGWVPGSLDRSQLPVSSPVQGVMELTAEVYVPLGDPFVLKDLALPPGWPKRIQALDLGELSGELGEPIYPYVLRLKAGESTVFRRHWQDINVVPAKHTAYAVQWFAMAAALLGMFIAMGFGIGGNRAGDPEQQ